MCSIWAAKRLLSIVGRVLRAGSSISRYLKRRLQYLLQAAGESKRKGTVPREENTTTAPSTGEPTGFLAQMLKDNSISWTGFSADLK
jgi:hypothetical protein